MGATVIRGRTDTKLFVWQVDDNDDRRIIRSDNREGTKLPKTYLVFNPETHMSTLGMTVAEASKKVGKSIQERIESDILTYYAARPNSPNTPDTMRLIQGNNAAKKRAFRMLVFGGMLTITGGKGTKGDPFLYSTAALPTEMVATPALTTDAADSTALPN
jgi:hypothetical protein